MAKPKILLTTDMSEAAARAFEPVCALAKKLRASITLLHVVGELPTVLHGSPLMPTVELDDELQAAREKLEKLQERLAKGGTEVHVAVVKSPTVAPAIVEFAARGGFFAIALARHSRGLKRLLLGSVADHVVRHAEVPVWVFP